MHRIERLSLLFSRSPAAASSENWIFPFSSAALGNANSDQGLTKAEIIWLLKGNADLCHNSTRISGEGPESNLAHLFSNDDWSRGGTDVPSHQVIPTWIRRSSSDVCLAQLVSDNDLHVALRWALYPLAMKRETRR